MNDESARGDSFPPDELISDLVEILEEDESVEPASPAGVDVRGCFPAELLDKNNRHGTPLVILDAALHMQWRNEAFRSFRETKGLEYRGRPFHALFTTFADKTMREELMAAVNTIEHGYGWQGHVEGRGQENRQFSAYLSIIPLKDDENGKPGWYLAVVDDLTESYKSVVRANFDSILKASLLKDEDTGNHLERVNAYSRLLAEEMKTMGRWVEVDDDFIEDIGFLAAFHDVGKIGTPESILLKNDQLTEDEWKVMKEHPINGALILDAHPNAMGKEIARCHHERWDGSGYPYCLTGEDIPLSGRIVAVADVYDALRTQRPYKEPFSESDTYAIITDGSGAHFDPGLVEVFSDLRDDFDQIFSKLSDK